MYIISHEFLYERPLVLGFCTPKAVGDNLYARRTLGSDEISAEDVARTQQVVDTVTGGRTIVVAGRLVAAMYTHALDPVGQSVAVGEQSSGMHSAIEPPPRCRFVSSATAIARAARSYRFFFRRFDYTTYAAVHVFRTTFRISYNDHDYYVVCAVCSRVGALGGRCIPAPCVCAVHLLNDSWNSPENHRVTRRWRSTCPRGSGV